MQQRYSGIGQKSKGTIEKLEVQSSILKLQISCHQIQMKRNTVLEIYTSLFADNRVTSVNKGYALRGLVQLKGRICLMMSGIV